MAISPIIPNGAFVRVYGTAGNQLTINVYGARVFPETVINQALAETLGASIKSAWSANFATRFNGASSIVRVGIRDMRVANQAEFRDTGAPVVGAAAAVDAMPGNVACCITLRTASSGKSFRGRTYISGWAEPDNDVNGHQSAAAASAAVTYMTAVKTAFTNAGLALAVASRPAERFEIVKTTFHADGSTTSDTIGRGSARTGSINDVIALESRTNLWESQRTRNNSRGITPTLLTPVAQQFFET